MNIRTLHVADIELPPTLERLRDLAGGELVAEGTPEEVAAFEADARPDAYESEVDGTVHVAMVMGEIGEGEDVLVRVHSECLTGDVFGSTRCDCGAQLHRAMDLIQAEGTGAILLALRSGGKFVTNPDPARSLEVGDVLIVVGTADQVHAAIAAERLNCSWMAPVMTGRVLALDPGPAPVAVRG